MENLEKLKKKERENLTRDSGGAVNEDEDHAAEDPRDSDGADAAADAAAAEQVRLGLVADHRQNGDVQEQQSRDELRDYGSVKGPFGKFLHIDHRRRQRLEIVLPGRRPRTADFNVVGRHRRIQQDQ